MCPCSSMGMHNKDFTIRHLILMFSSIDVHMALRVESVNENEKKTKSMYECQQITVIFVPLSK